MPADRRGTVQMKAALSYHWFRAQAVAWLAIGRHEKARKIIGHLRRCEPRMAAQLENEFGVQGRAGQWAHAVSPQGAAMDMAGNAAH